MRGTFGPGNTFYDISINGVIKIKKLEVLVACRITEDSIICDGKVVLSFKKKDNLVIGKHISGGSSHMSF